MEFKRAHREPQRGFLNLRTGTAPSDYSEQFSQDCGSEPTHGIQDGISESVTVPSRNLHLIQKALGNCHSRKESKSSMCPCWLWIRGYHAEIRKLGLNMHLDGKKGQEIGSDGSNQRVKLEVGWGWGGVSVFERD